MFIIAFTHLSLFNSFNVSENFNEIQAKGVEGNPITLKKRKKTNSNKVQSMNQLV